MSGQDALPCRARLGTLCLPSSSSRGICSSHVTSPLLFLTHFESKNKKSKHFLQVQSYANQSFTILTVIFFHWKTNYTNGLVKSQSPWNWAEAAILQREVKWKRRTPARSCLAATRVLCGPQLPSQTSSSVSVAPAEEQGWPLSADPQPQAPLRRLYFSFPDPFLQNCQ